MRHQSTHYGWKDEWVKTDPIGLFCLINIDTGRAARNADSSFMMFDTQDSADRACPLGWEVRKCRSGK